MTLVPKSGTMGVKQLGALGYACMRVFGTAHLTLLCEQVPGCKRWVEAWLADLRGLKRVSISALQQRYPSAVSSGGKILIFTFLVNGEQFFTRVQVADNTGVLLVKWAGPATQYEHYLAEVNHAT